MENSDETTTAVSPTATLGTDVHQSKISPDDPRLRIERPRSRTLRRGPALLAVGVVGLVVAIALVVALAGPSGQTSPASDTRPEPTPQATTQVELPDVLKESPGDKDQSPSRSDGGEDPLAHPSAGTGAQQMEAVHQVGQEDLARARGAGLFAGFDDVSPAGAPATTTVVHPGDSREGSSNGVSSAATRSDSSRAPDPNLQERKNDFLTPAGVSDADYLEKAVAPPRSPFEVKAGTVIPTVLISGINSDLPGQVIAQVRENVYDTVSGNHLLIPQGSRLLAAYDSMVAWGQERVLVCWNRLIRPDGTSLRLGCMPGVDLAGYSGHADGVDNHWWRIAGGAVFSSLLAATAQRSQDDVTGFQPTFPQVWANNAAGQVNQTGQQLTQKNLQTQPTITIRPGFSVNVLVTKDIVIEPYTQTGALR